MTEVSKPTRVCGLTGATGFVGTYLSPALQDRGWRVVPITRDATNFGDASALADFLAAHGVSDIVHLAAEANPSAGDSRAFYETNSFLTDRLLEAAVRVGLPGRFLYVSAASVYGDSAEGLHDERTPLRPLNHYAASKALAETFVDWRRAEIDVAIARPSNCIGRGQNPRYLIAKLSAAFVAREPEISLGDVDIARDFVDVRDACDILERALSAPISVAPIVNVASGRATQIREILALLTDITGHSPRILRDERFIRTGDMRRQKCDVSIARELGHSPSHNLRDSLSWILGTV